MVLLKKRGKEREEVVGKVKAKGMIGDAGGLDEAPSPPR